MDGVDRFAAEAERFAQWASHGTAKGEAAVTEALLRLTNSEIGHKFPIFLVPYDPRWVDLFAVEARLVQQALGPALALRIEHIGSTAVPCMTAKPIIDMLLQVPSWEAAEQQVATALAQLGYACVWVSNQEPERHLHFPKGYDFSKEQDWSTVPKFHIHAAPSGHSLWDRIHFRDYLREHPRPRSWWAARKA